MGGSKRVLLCIVALVPSCGPKVAIGGSSADDGGTSSSSGDGSASGSGPTTLTTSPATGVTAGSSTTSTVTTANPSTSSESEGEESGADVGCTADHAREFAEQSKRPPFECGTVGPDDGVQSWLDLHNCVIELGSALTGGFWAEWSVAGDPYAYSVAGAEGATYELGWWETSGFGTIIAYDCSTITEIDGCTVEPGVICLSCERKTQTAVLCDPK